MNVNLVIDRSTIKLAPLILAADFACLREQVGGGEQAGADRICVDIIDGHFVPNLTLQLDGCVDATTGPSAANAGASVLAAGSSIFTDPEGISTVMDRLLTAGNDYHADASPLAIGIEHEKRQS